MHKQKIYKRSDNAFVRLSEGTSMSGDESRACPHTAPKRDFPCVASHHSTPVPWFSLTEVSEAHTVLPLFVTSSKSLLCSHENSQFANHSYGSLGPCQHHIRLKLLGLCLSQSSLLRLSLSLRPRSLWLRLWRACRKPYRSCSFLFRAPFFFALAPCLGGS